MMWDSPKVREIEKEYGELWDTYDKTPEKIAGDGGKSKHGEVRWLVDRLFRKRLSDENLRRLVASCDALPARASERSWFANDLLAFMVKHFVRRGDRTILVELLSKRCPGRIRFSSNGVGLTR
jgi:hypothetical protein